MMADELLKGCLGTFFWLKSADYLLVWLKLATPAEQDDAHNLEPCFAKYAMFKKHVDFKAILPAYVMAECINLT
jgi:hypothetical protein